MYKTYWSFQHQENGHQFLKHIMHNGQYWVFNLHLILYLIFKFKSAKFNKYFIIPFQLSGPRLVVLTHERKLILCQGLKFIQSVFSIPTVWYLSVY